jgi:hypothetical protein
MTDPRHIADYAAWRAALLPRVHAVRVALRNTRTRRPASMRVKDDEELRVLGQCRARRRARLAAAGVLVQTGPRTWVLTLPGSREFAEPRSAAAHCRPPAKMVQ